MHKTAMPPRTKPLARGKPPQHKTPIRKRNPERAARLDREACGPHADYVRRHPCRICGHVPVQAHHVKSRGAGGKAENNLIPLCPVHHERVHRGRKTFEREHKIDQAKVAAGFWEDSPANPKNVPEGGKSGRRRPHSGRDDELTGHPGTHSPVRER